MRSSIMRIQAPTVCLSILLALLLVVETTESWVPSSSCRRRFQSQRFLSKPSPETTTTTTIDIVDEDAPAGIVGAEFFGGNKEKIEFFDPVAEAQVGTKTISSETLTTDDTMNRFTTSLLSFDSEATAALAETLQAQFETPANKDKIIASSAVYSPSLIWNTFLAVNSNQPLQELKDAQEFYRDIYVAITGGRAISDTEYEFRWEISLSWPVIWEPRVLLTGTSRLTVQEVSSNNNKQTQITRQSDQLDEPDLFLALVRQLSPRFWDLYHIGMTPCAELSPELSLKAPSNKYQLLSLPPRWYVQATMQDTGERADNVAAIIPNHAFATAIKTMGPLRQNYVTVSPVQVTIAPPKQGSSSKRNQITWLLPMAVNAVATTKDWVLPGPDEEADDGAEPEATYVWMPKRKVAVVPYSGRPQDAEITDVRKKLYEQVVKDGLQPKLDENGRPMFFFWQDSVKACYTSDGLGMAVYEWRPGFTKPCRVGIEIIE